MTGPLLHRLIRLLLRPVVHTSLRAGVLLQEVVQLLKEEYIEVAETELERIDEKRNVSRLSVMTGVHRADVRRIFKERAPAVGEEPISLLGKVIDRWTNEKRYQTKTGKPKTLTRVEFSELVSSISTTINPGTVFFEMSRNGAITETAQGIKLVRGTRALGAFPDKAYEMLARDIETLVKTVEDNVLQQTVDPSLPSHAHYRTEYDNIFVEDLPEIREWIVERSREFHREVRAKLASHDGDYAENVGKTEESGARVVVTLFSHTEEKTTKKQ
ncbi:MAG: hypothetical protein KDD64_04215 [Bdellovibrionales bacterium]|nr:hypothetical protein [Bdellovibrionales bacterium]